MVRYYRVAETHLNYHGIRYFMYNPERRKVVQVCAVQGHVKKGRPNCIGITTIDAVGFRSNYLGFQRVVECTQEDYERMFAVTADRLKTIEE